MTWYLDDGGLMGTGNRIGKLATNGFSQEQSYQLAEFLYSKFQIQAKVYPNTYANKTYYYLQISTQQLKKLLCTIMPHIPVQSMLYKAYLKYTRLDLQQHWIAVMYELIKPELHSDLQKLVGFKPDLTQYARTLLNKNYSENLVQELVATASKFIDLISEDLN